MSWYICIDIGGTAIKYGIVNNDGLIVESNELQSNAHLGGNHIVGCVKDIINQYIKKYSIEGVGISTAGMVDTIKGEITYAGKQIPNYIGVNWKKIINEEFNLNCAVENDVNCAGLAEAISGAGKGHKSSVCVTIGTGIGACMIVDNKIFHGNMGSAFEIGYMNFGEGQFQDLASTTALVKNVANRKNMKMQDLDGRKIFDIAKSGDVICNEEIQRMMEYIAMGLSNICYVVNPGIVILGGGIMEQHEFLRPILNSWLEKYLLPHILENTVFDFAKNRNNAGILGAYFNLTKHLNNK
ncbi:MAG: ROK family protein [Filifactoraceae bacterium]